MAKKKIEIIEINELDINRLYSDSGALKLARIAGIQDSAEVQSFFQVVKFTVMLYIYLHNREQNLNPSKEYKKAKRFILYLDKSLLSAGEFATSNRDIFNINAALDQELAVKKPSTENNTMTADINMLDAKGQSSWMVTGYPSASGWQSLLFHGKIDEPGKILTNPADALEDHLTNLKIMRQRATVILKELELRKSDRTRNYPMRQVIALLRDVYEKFSGKRATLSNTGSGDGASGIFKELSEAVFRPVLPSYWKNRRLDSVINNVLYPKSRKNPKKCKEAKGDKIIVK